MSLTEEFADLGAAVLVAQERQQKAWRRRQNEFEVSAEQTADLTAYRDDIGFKKRDPDLTEQRRLTKELTERIEADGLVLESAGGGPGLLIVRDPKVQSELEASRLAVTAAKTARREFEAEHAEALAAERAKAEMDRVREALASDDPTEFREALSV